MDTTRPGQQGSRAKMCVGIAVLCFVFGASSGEAAEAKSFIDQAYQKTSAATTVQDYTQIVQLCADAEKAGLSAEQAEYVNKLLAWAYNRRGEVYSQAAAEAVQNGKAEESRKLDENALSDYELALRFDDKKWKTWHNLAVSRALAGKYEDAIAGFDQVIALKPDYANAWFNRAEILCDLGRYPEAVKSYSEVLKLLPTDVGAVTGRAQAQLRAGQFAAAMTDFDRAVELAPQDTDVLVNRAEAHLSQGKWIEGANDLVKALQINSESARLLQLAAWVQATSPEDQVRNPDQAVAYAERAVELAEQAGNQDYRFLDTLAAAFANANRFDEAISRATQAVPLAPPEQVAAVKKRLELYRQNKPYRQTSGEKTAAAPTKKAKAR